MNCVIGVDLGGTNVRAELIFASGERKNRVEIPSSAQEGTAACVASVAEAINQARKGAEPTRVGMAVPGHIQNNVVRWAPNFGEWREGKFHHWRDVKLGESIEAQTGLPVVMGNDANLAALGEFRYGCGKNSANGLVLLTLGTGIGGGIILSPRSVMGGLSRPTVLVGGNGGGAELGHIVIVKDGDPHPSAVAGTLEAYCNKDAIIRRALARLTADSPDLLARLCAGNPENLTPKLLADAAADGDRAALAVWEETGDFLGVGIGSIINTFAPEIVALGGQIAKAGALILNPAIESARRTAIPTLFSDTRIVLAEQVEDAGILGAAALAFEEIE